MSPSTASPTCAHCGTSDKERLYLREEHCHCCEGCLLDRCIGHKPTLDLAGLYSGFVEALVRTLDLRELETGLHSRRSACHTLVLARRIISDAEELRQIYWGALLHFGYYRRSLNEHLQGHVEALPPARHEVASAPIWRLSGAANHFKCSISTRPATVATAPASYLRRQLAVTTERLALGFVETS